MIQNKRLERRFYDLPKDQRGVNSSQSAFVRGLGGLKGIVWDELLQSKRIQITSEAGTGKTHECSAEQKARFDAGEAAFFFELSQLRENVQLTDLMSGEELVRFEAWLISQSDIAILFLDSYDELKLTRGSFETALKRIARTLSGQLGRVKIVVTTRPIPFDDELIREHLPVPSVDQEFNETSFADVVMGVDKKKAKKEDEKKKAKEWRSVELLPLSDSQIAEFADMQDVEDTAALLSDIRSRNAEEFARRPQDLIELCVDWRDHHRIRTHREQVETNVAVKLKARTDREEKSQLTNDKAIEGASRLALAMLLSRKLNLRYSVESDRGEVGIALDPLKVLTDWSATECQTLLERALFGFAGYGRVRFHNQSVVEYLAARQLKTMLDNGMSIKAVKRILFAKTAQGVKVVKPTMRPVAAWLALSHESIFRELRDREPEVLIALGDPESLTLPQRRQILVAYFERNCNGGWRGQDFYRIQLMRFGSKDLADDVLNLLNQEAENPEVRQILYELVSAVPMAACADKAFEVAMNQDSETGERIYAIEALRNLKDERIKQIAQSLVESPENWPDRLFTNSILRLFPSSIDLDSLRKLLVTRPETNRDCENVGGFLAGAIENEELEFAAGYLNELSAILTELVLAGVKPTKSWPHLLPKRQHLLEPLAAACLRLLESGDASDSILDSSISAIRLAENSNTNEKPITRLRSYLQSLPPETNERAFWIADAFNQRFRVEDNNRFRVGEIVHHCGLQIGEDDAAWVLSELQNTGRTTEHRALLLEAAIYWTCNKEDYREYLLSLKSKVADCKSLTERIDDRLKTPEPDPELKRMEREDETYREKQIREEQEAHASWVSFWNEVSNHPDIAFGEDKLENTTWNLWNAMKRSGEKGRASGWNRRFIEEYFGKDTADRLRESLMAAWRKDKPTFRSERPVGEKGTFYSHWELGLAGIAAESEDPDWATRLMNDEVEIALRYVSLEINGLPSWLKSLANQHPEIVKEVLGRECVCELDELADKNGHFFLLQKLRYSEPELGALFVERLSNWFAEHNERVREEEIPHKILSRLSDVTELLLKHGDGKIRSDLLAIATQRLNEGVEQTYLGFWLSILIRLDPEAGTLQLENFLAENSKPEVAEALFAHLFGNHRESSGFHSGIHEFSASLLLRLVKMAYTKIKQTDDNVHDGSYQPNQRDNAERGRGSLLNALLAKEGPDAWAAKIEMANDPLFSHFRDRALALALEKAAEELDREQLSQSDLVKLFSGQESPPKTRDTMYEVLIDRLEDFDELLLHDDSPREAWALIEDERIMRRVIARQLRLTANDIYTVDQESVTADEKETDTRLRSTASLQQAVIELKLGEKDRSGRDLRDTLREQLVIKYMADDNCRSGCLLVTISTDRQWQHPESGEMLDPAGLEKMLCEEASEIEAEMGHSLRVTAKVIDLRPRLKTEKNSRKK